MSTAKLIGLSLEEFWTMDPCDFLRMCGNFMERQGKVNPYKVYYIDE
ncbi:hypothetical protein LJC74_03895 [Eubacteriales bacterium OttesenSCG-928-A19]|nr:hypothetical protein [Eubacteriales bacterium OttesenSCG-928-A19]